MTRFARFAWGVLAFDVLVALWGAYVRATGSGAGCGRHWPLCQGAVVPRAPRVETLVELSHRLSAASAMVLTAILAIWAFAAFPRRHAVRRAAGAAVAFMAAEALIGAGLVLFELVAHDASAKRALSVAGHLVNTFFLLGSTALAAWWSDMDAPVRAGGARSQALVLWTTGLPLVAMIFVGSSGAVAALGDTLFPSTSLASGVARDIAPSAHIFVRLRVLHPVLAAGTAVLIVAMTGVTRSLRPGRSVSVLSRAAGALAVAQVGAGLLDVTTLAPVWAQLIHLALADGLWIALVLTGAAALCTVTATAGGGPLSDPLRPPEPVPPNRRARWGGRAGAA